MLLTASHLHTQLFCGKIITKNVSCVLKMLFIKGTADEKGSRADICREAGVFAVRDIGVCVYVRKRS